MVKFDAALTETSSSQSWRMVTCNLCPYLKGQEHHCLLSDSLSSATVMVMLLHKVHPEH